MVRKTKKRRKRPQEEYVHYVATVSSWEHMYGFGVGMCNRYEHEPYSEYGSLTITGEVVRPENFKCPKAEFVFYTKRGMFDEKWDTPPKSIGTLSSHEDLLRICVFVPQERMAEMATIAASDRLQAIAFTGTKMKWRKGVVINIELMTDFIEEDW